MPLLGNLVIAVSATSDGFNRGISEAQSRLASFSSSVQSTFAAFKSGSAGASAAFDWMTGLANSIPVVGPAVSAVGKGISLWASQYRDATREAQKFGETIQGMDRIKLATGSGFDNAETAMGKLQGELAAAASGSADARAKFDQTGLSWKELASIPLGDAFAAVAQKSNEAGSQVEKAHLAYTLFGKGAAEVIPVLEKLGKNWDAAGKMAQNNAMYTAGQQMASEFVDGFAARHKQGMANIATFAGIIRSDLDKMGVTTPRDFAAEEQAKRMKLIEEQTAAVEAMRANNINKMLEPLNEHIRAMASTREEMEKQKLLGEGANEDEIERLEAAQRVRKEIEDRNAALKDQERIQQQLKASAERLTQENEGGFDSFLRKTDELRQAHLRGGLNDDTFALGIAKAFNGLDQGGPPIGSSIEALTRDSAASFSAINRFMQQGADKETEQERATRILEQSKAIQEKQLDAAKKMVDVLSGLEGSF